MPTKANQTELHTDINQKAYTNVIKNVHINVG